MSLTIDAVLGDARTLVSKRDHPGGWTRLPLWPVFSAHARPTISAVRRPLEIRSERGRVICSRCVVADTFFSRLRGLLGRRELHADESLLLSPTSSIHTFFMRFPIDVVFLDRDLTVLATREPVRPWRMASCRRAHSALELPAGACSRWAIRPGD